MPTRLMPSSIPGPTLTVHPGLRPAPPPPLTSQDRSWPATPFAPAFFASDRHPAGTSRAPARLGRSAAEIERGPARSEEHTSELQSLMRISYAVFCLKTKNTSQQH